MAKLVLAILVGIFLAIAANSAGVRQIDVPGQGPVFVWTPDEMDRLEAVLTDLLAQRDKLSKQLSNCKQGT